MTIASPAPSDRVLTVPNLLSVLRLLALPVFVWLVLVRHQDGWGGLLIGVSALSDNLDGYIARHHDQVSRLGQLLDPIVDRVVVLTTLVVLAVSGALPWPLAALVVVRDVLLVLVIAWLRVRGHGSLPVNYVGKIGTFALVFSFPFLLIGHGANTAGWIADASTVLAWAVFPWGFCLYWAAAGLYLWQAGGLLRGRQPPPVAASARPDPTPDTVEGAR